MLYIFYQSKLCKWKITNKVHYFCFVNGNYISQIISPTQFKIPVTLSAYPLNNVKTDTPAPFTLGSHGKVFPEKHQCSFDFLVRCTGRKRELTNKFTMPGPTSLWKTSGYNRWTSGQHKQGPVRNQWSNLNEYWAPIRQEWIPQQPALRQTKPKWIFKDDYQPYRDLNIE